MTKEEKARFDDAVRKEVEKIAAAQQKQFARMMEQTMKNSLKGVDKTNAALGKERLAVVKELGAAQALHAKAEREGDKMANAYFEGRQLQFKEAACTELLRNLVRMHLETGKTHRDIAVWLDVPLDFIKKINEVVERVQKFRSETKKRTRIEGNPKLRYSDYGRGGTVYYESPDTQFDMWWEFATGDAIVILDVPRPENWESRTKLPLAERERVLTFIGEQLLEDKNSGMGTFIIGENVITFYD